MENTILHDIILPVVGLVFGSQAVFTFLQFVISRHDNRKGMEKQIKRIDSKIDEKFAILARTHILRFADDLRNGVEHSEDYFRQQLQDCDCYERYCDEHPDFCNGLTRIANEYIKEEYRKLYTKGEDV